MTDIEAMNAFMAEPRNAVVAGIRADGRPHLTPNWFVFDDGKFFISTTNDRAKYRIFNNDPRAQLIIDDVTGFRYVVVDGVAEVSEDNEFGLPYSRHCATNMAVSRQTMPSCSPRWNATVGCCSS